MKHKEMKYPYMDLPSLNNANIEGKETILLPDGRSYNIKGKSHANDGEDVFLPEGSKVFSNHLKLPKDITSLLLDDENNTKKMSPADISKKYDTLPYHEMLTTRINRYNDLSKKTAAFMLSKLNGIHEDIFMAQEEYKDKKGIDTGNTEKYQSGGSIPRYNPNTINQFNTNDFTFNPLDPTNLIPARQPSIGGGYFGEPQSIDIFKANNPWYDFTGFDPSNSQSVRNFQESFNEELGKRSNRLGTTPENLINQSGFSGTAGANKLDGKFGEFTSTRQLPELNVSPAQSIPSRNILEVQSNTESTPLELPTPDVPNELEQRVPVGMSTRDYINGIQNGLLLSQLASLEVENPYYRFSPSKIATTRFEPVNTKQSERAFNIAKESLENSNVPESVKNAQLAQMQANMQGGINQVDITNYQGNLQNQNQNTSNLINVLNTDSQRRDQANLLYLQDRARGRENFQKSRNAIVENMLTNWKESYRNKRDEELLSQLANNYNIVNGQIQYSPGQGFQNPYNNLSGFTNNVTKEQAEIAKLQAQVAALQNK